MSDDDAISAAGADAGRQEALQQLSDLRVSFLGIAEAEPMLSRVLVTQCDYVMGLLQRGDPASAVVAVRMLILTTDAARPGYGQ